MDLKEYQAFVDGLDDRSDVVAVMKDDIAASKDDDDLANVFVDNMSARAAAPIFGVSHSTVARLGRKLGYVEGLDGKRRLNRKVPGLEDVRNALILQLREEEMSVRAIASEVRCSAGTVHRVIQAYRLAD